MGVSVDLRGIEQVLRKFDSRNTPFYAVTCGSELKFSNTDESLDKAKNKLTEELEEYSENGTTAIYKIQWYEKLDASGKLTKENLIGSDNFRLNQIGDGIGGGSWDRERGIVGYANSNPVMKLLEQLVADNKAIKEEIAEMKNETDPEMSEGMKMISGLMSDPHIKSLVIPRIMGLVDMILPVKSNGMQSNAATISGTITADDITLMNQSLEILLNNGVVPNDIKLLADMATQNPAQLQMLLAMLRK
jgi:hypothetical protein